MTSVKNAGIAIALGVATLVPTIAPAEAGRAGRHFGAQQFRPNLSIPHDMVFQRPKRTQRPGRPWHPRHDKCEDFLDEYHDTGVHSYYLEYIHCLHGY